MKWRRLWQPQRLLFWQMLVFNILSSVCSWALRTLPLNRLGTVIVSLAALLNVAFGLLAAWALLREPAPGEEAQAQPPAGPAASGDSANTAGKSD